ncbi:MAG: hypothetical protein ABFE01_02985 [Phycisphaerales bacterium]
MTRDSRILIGVAILALLCGVILLVLTAVGATQIVAGKQTILLKGMRYDPYGDVKRRHETLHALAERVLHQRIHYQRAFHYTLGTSCIVTGLLLIGWTVDHERLRRRISKTNLP